jgi:hypothetical protein
MDLLAKSNTGVLLFWPQWPPGTGPTDRIGLSDAHNHSARVTSKPEVIPREELPTNRELARRLHGYPFIKQVFLVQPAPARAVIL